MVPLAAPLAALQAAINAAAGLSLRRARTFDVGFKKIRIDVLYQIQVGLNPWSGAFSGQGFRAAGQRA